VEEASSVRVSALVLVLVSIPHWSAGVAGLVWAAVIRGIYCAVQNRRGHETAVVSPWLLGLAALCALFAVIGSQSANAAGAGTRTETHNGVTCAWRTEMGGAATCQRSDRIGYIVTVSQSIVLVRNGANKIVFWRNQPAHSPGFGDIHDSRITYTVTSNNVRCFWTRVGGGGAFCNKANNHGYVAGVAHLLASVAQENSKVVFLKSQP
jgi:hypothetical protein